MLIPDSTLLLLCEIWVLTWETLQRPVVSMVIPDFALLALGEIWDWHRRYQPNFPKPACPVQLLLPMSWNVICDCVVSYLYPVMFYMWCWLEVVHVFRELHHNCGHCTHSDYSPTPDNQIVFLDLDAKYRSKSEGFSNAKSRLKYRCLMGGATIT